MSNLTGSPWTRQRRSSVTKRKLSAVAYLTAAVILVVLGSTTPVVAAPCATATAACEQWVQARPSAGRTLVYSTYPLTVRNEQITRALILVHGGGRDAQNYFRTAVAAALLGGALEDTIVMAPRFTSSSGACRDVLAMNEIGWDCGEGSTGGWRIGAAGVTHRDVTSFDLMDQLVTQAATRGVFPSLRQVTIAGFSAGGQFVNRYQMANRVHEKVGVPVTYVVGSPSSYGYLDGMRPAGTGGSVGPFADGNNCTTFNQWPYGLNGRTGYSARLTDDDLRRQFLSRPTTFVIGELETPQSPALDVACPAMAQGVSRMARAEAFFKYVTEKYGAMHRMLAVPQCGHSQRCVLTADTVLPLLFPKTE